MQHRYLISSKLMCVPLVTLSDSQLLSLLQQVLLGTQQAFCKKNPALLSIPQLQLRLGNVM